MASITFIVALFIASLAATPTHATTANQAAATVTPTAGTATATAVDGGAYPPCPDVIGVPVQATSTPAPSATATNTPTATFTPTATSTPDPNITPAPTMFLDKMNDKPGCKLTADLWGMFEVPTAGDPDGGGSVAITMTRPNTGGGDVCFQIDAGKITLPATKAGIFMGAPTEPGTLVLPLPAPDATGRATGCIKNVDRNLIKAIVTRPAKFFVNVITSDFPGGALRGQLIVPVSYPR